MSSYKATGIILRRSEYGEADRIYTILTPERKVSAIAKGVRKSTAKLASHLDLFTEIELMFATGKRLDVITSARAVKQYDPSGDYERLRRGFLYLEMADKLTDTESVGGVYELLRQAFESLDTAPPALGELSFKLKLLYELGHAPDLSVESDGDGLGLDIEQGLLVEVSDSTLAIPIDKDSIKLWRLLLVRPLGQLQRIKGAHEAADRSLPVINRFIEQQFGKRFKAAEL